MAGQNRGYFLPTTHALDVSELYQTDVNSQKFKEFLANIINQLNNMAIQINSKGTGFYGTQEIATGETFFPNSNRSSATDSFATNRPVFRKLVCVGPLPKAATSPKLVPHGIAVNANFCAVKVSGCATDPVGLVAIPLPYVSGESPTKSVGIKATATDIVITVSPASDFTAYTHAFVILEYVKN